MNYLAHLYLSGNTEGLIIGNFIADSVRGSQMKDYSDEIQKGIYLHRKIDSYTDKHEVVKKSKARLNPEHHKYSPVIIDVFYDHFLAVNWDKYSSVPLRNYCDLMYKLLNKKSYLFPKRSRRFLFYLSMNDMLFRYSTIKGVERTLQILSYRARFESKMHTAHRNLLEDYDLYQQEFMIFFEDLKKNSLAENFNPGIL